MRLSRVMQRRQMQHLSCNMLIAEAWRCDVAAGMCGPSDSPAGPASLPPLWLLLPRLC